MTAEKRQYLKGGRRHRHEVKVSPEEEAEIAMAAAGEGVTWVRFVTEAALAVARAEGDGVPETVSARRRQVQELFALQAPIGEVAWQMRKVGVNVNQLTKAVHQGQALPIEEMRAFLVEQERQSRAARALYDRITVLIDERVELGVRA